MTHSMDGFHGRGLATMNRRLATPGVITGLRREFWIELDWPALPSSIERAA